MAETTPPPLPETEQTVVVNPWHKRNLFPDEIKQVLLTPLAGHGQSTILRGGIFVEVGQRFGITQQQPHGTCNTALVVARVF
jgi:hypothetical protein